VGAKGDINALSLTLNFCQSEEKPFLNYTLKNQLEGEVFQAGFFVGLKPFLRKANI